MKLIISYILNKKITLFNCVPQLGQVVHQNAEPEVVAAHARTFEHLQVGEMQRKAEKHKHPVEFVIRKGRVAEELL